MSWNVAINVVFSIALVIHVFLVVFSMIYPNTPSVKVYKKSFNEINFPISIKICATEDRDSDIMRHNVTGYARVFKFFMGESMFNDSLFGWRGHTKDGSTLGSTQGKFAFRFNQLNLPPSRCTVQDHSRLYCDTLVW